MGVLTEDRDTHLEERGVGVFMNVRRDDVVTDPCRVTTRTGRWDLRGASSS